VRTLTVAIALLLTFPLAAKTSKIRKKDRPVKDSYIVVLKEENRGNVRQVAHELAKRYGGLIVATWEDALRGFAITTNEAGALAVAEDPRVFSVAEDSWAIESQFCIKHCAPVSQTSSRCNNGKVPWQVDRIDQANLPLNNYYENCATSGQNVRIYIIDSGVDDHSEFKDKNGNPRLQSGWSYFGGPTTDCNGHGTANASLAAGLGAGVAKSADIVPVRVSSCTTNPSETTVITGINWVIQDHVSGPAVASISLTFGGDADIDNAVNNLIADGVVVVVSAGNANSNACGLSPARVPNAITVGATTKTDAKSSYSNYGSCVTLFAPGDGVGAASYGHFNDLDCSPGLSGTSRAAPLVAGVAAIAYGAYYDDGYTPAMIKNLLVNRAARKVTGAPSGTTNRLLQATVFDCTYPVCAIICTDPRCTNDPTCPPPDR